MRTLTGAAVTLTVMILLYAIRKPALRWCFTRDLPETPEGWQPRYRTWHAGTMTEGEWT